MANERFIYDFKEDRAWIEKEDGIYEIINFDLKLELEFSTSRISCWNKSKSKREKPEYRGTKEDFYFDDTKKRCE